MQIFLIPSLALADDTQKALKLNSLIVTGKRAESLEQNMPGNIKVISEGETFIHPVEALARVPGDDASWQWGRASDRNSLTCACWRCGRWVVFIHGRRYRCAAGFSNVNALLDAQNEHSERIEVIKAPGPAMYGSNAVHGLVNFITTSPYDANSDMQARFGSYGRYRLTANMTSQNKGTEKVYRLGVTLSGETEGYRAASGFDQQRIKFQSGWQGGADTNYRLIISANHLEQETAGYASSYRNRQFAKMNTDDNAFRNAESLRAALYTETSLSGNKTLRLTPYIRYHDMRF